jgi:type II secretory pathway component PulF
MPSFVFKGTNRKGESVSGERIADTKQALAMALRREQIFLLDAQEKKAGGKFNLEFGGNPTAKDVAVLKIVFSFFMDCVFFVV